METTYWVFWKAASGVSHARDFAGDAAEAHASGFREGLLAAGVKCRFERHDPSPHHDRFDVTVLYPTDGDAEG